MGVGLRPKWIISLAILGCLFILVFSSLGAGTQRPPTLSGASLAKNDPARLIGTGSPQLSLASASLAHGAGTAVGQPSPYRSATWSNLSAIIGGTPSGRLTTMTWDTADGYVVLFGGQTVAGVLSDTWTYLNGTWTNITATIIGSPPGLEETGMAYDPGSSSVILFGGFNHTFAYQKQTWSYHAKRWTNLTSSSGTSPSARLLPAMATDSTDGQVVLFGGMSSGPLLKDTWIFRNGTWSNETSRAPVLASITYPMASDDPPDHGVLLFGTMNWNRSHYEAGTFLFTGGIWRNLTSTFSTQPPRPPLGALDFVPAASAVFLHVSDTFNKTGGSTVVDLTWEYVGGVWKNVTVATGQQPVGALLGGHALDAWDNSWILFGGSAFKPPYYPTDTWVLSALPVVTATTSQSIIDAGMSVAFTGSISDGLAPNALAWTFGDGGSASTLSPTHGYTGAGLFTATLAATSLSGAVGSASVSVYANAVLRVANVTPPTATVGSSTWFAVLVLGGTEPLTYAWNFGDGSEAGLGASPLHVYAKLGAYVASVKVTDSLGSSANGSVKVTVASKSSGPGVVSLTSGTGLVLVAVILVLLAVSLLLGMMRMRPPKTPTSQGPPGGTTDGAPRATPGPPPLQSRAHSPSG
ncbi:MAG: PKD domain-containing protein [Thermoplasmata archaeon]|nr:PKD domain-containing protein [Thermoplasmata archaeon]